MTTRNAIRIDDVDYELSDEFLAHVLQTAVEGACSYWADVSAEPAGNGGDIDGVRDFDLSDYIEGDNNADDDAGEGYTKASFLVTEDPTQGGTLELQGVADAIERIASGEVAIPPAIRAIVAAAVQEDNPSDIDAEAADCIVQVGLFDEIVYQ
jgi:hypothetical protein